MAVILRGKLPPGDTNGLSRLAERLAEEPERIYVVMALDTAKVVSNLDDETDPVSVILRIAQAEVADEAQAMMILDLLKMEYARRTGKAELPWDDIPSGNETDIDNGKEDTE